MRQAEGGVEKAETHDHDKVEGIEVREPGDNLEEHITERFERVWGVVAGGYGPDIVGLIVCLRGCLIYVCTYIPTAWLIKPTTWTDNASLADSFTEGFIQVRKQISKFRPAL